MNIQIINGPKIHLIGNGRQPEVYGTLPFEDYFKSLIKTFPQHQLSQLQTDVEQELLDFIKHANTTQDAIVLNAAAFTHTSRGLAECLQHLQIPVVEVHISNIAARESFRHTSYVTPHVMGCVFGFGMKSYALAIQAIEHQSEE
ncbi:MAG: type II 3-dehydroquinate dehydratase [Flavobacteriaceae bacterium]|nr:type II 3-dehydroquinate dehydratase [Flavobacteriaceae bacterium]